MDVQLELPLNDTEDNAKPVFKDTPVCQFIKKLKEPAVGDLWYV